MQCIYWYALCREFSCGGVCVCLVCVYVMCLSSQKCVASVYSTNLCHSAICRRGELHTSFQWFNAVPPHLGPPISNRPITYFRIEYSRRNIRYLFLVILRRASTLTSFLVTRSQSNSINSNEMPSKHAPEPCEKNIIFNLNSLLPFGISKGNAVRNVKLPHWLECQMQNFHWILGSVCASSRAFSSLRFVGHCRADRFWHMDQPSQLHPFVVDYVPSTKQQSNVQHPVASKVRPTIHRVPGLESSKCIHGSRLIMTFHSGLWHHFFDVDITFKLLGWISLLRATCWLSIWFKSMLFNGHTTSPMTSSRE